MSLFDTETTEREHGRVHPADAPIAVPENRSSLIFIKDNLEAFAVAIVMALVIKHFCVEAFKIPTESMYPTLLGKKKSEEGIGDRILVDKWAYLFAAPERWHIPVFKYPLDRSRNFIKRIVGLPLELLRIHDGDIWIRKRDGETLEIARKNERVRNQLYTRVYPPAQPEIDLPDSFWRGASDGNGWTLESHARFVYSGGPSAALVTREGIREEDDMYSWGGRGSAGALVRDVRVAFEVTPGSLAEDAPTDLGVRWEPDGTWRASLRLSTEAGRSRVSIQRGAGTVIDRELAYRMRPGVATPVVVEYVDGDWRVRLDGTEVAVLPDGRRIDDPLERADVQQLVFDAQGGPLVVADVQIDRDLYYENAWSESRWGRDGIEIPEDCYFLMGDNTRESSDSRKWQLRTVHLKDGSEISYDVSAHVEWLSAETPGASERKRVMDANGVRRTWNEDDEDEQRGTTTRAAPFVWRELIVGRAFLIFWPLAPDFPGRLRFIH